jgi:hypothetical protein
VAVGVIVFVVVVIVVHMKYIPECDVNYEYYNILVRVVVIVITYERDIGT